MLRNIAPYAGLADGALARELLKKGYTVKAMTRNPESEKAKELVKLGAQTISDCGCGIVDLNV